MLLGPRTHKRIGRLRPSVSAPFAQQPGTPEPPGTPPQPPPDPMAPPLYEIPIPGPYQPPVIDDPQPRRSSPGSSDISNAGGVGVAPPGTAHYAKAPTNAATIPEKNGLRRPTRCRSRSPPNASPPRRPTATNRDGVKAQTRPCFLEAGARLRPASGCTLMRQLICGYVHRKVDGRSEAGVCYLSGDRSHFPPCSIVHTRKPRLPQPGFSL